MLTAPFMLHPEVRVAVTKDAAILLDLKNDRYLGLDAAHVRALGPLVCGWPRIDDATDPLSAADPEQGAAVATQLEQEGLLTKAGTHGRPVQPTSLLPPTQMLVDRDVTASPRITAGHIVNFLYACVWARTSLKLRKLGNTVRLLTRLREATPASCDLQRLRTLTHVFLDLRLLVYTPAEQCLFDSLVLIRFLSLYRQHPQLCIGVQAEPFYAHAWVQADVHTLNCRPELARRFHPILVV